MAMDPPSEQQVERWPHSPMTAETRLATRFSRTAGQASWVAGLTLALSSFMGWYSGSAPEGPAVSVLGWNTGTIGKLVFVLGIAVIVLAVARVVDVRLPSALPESVVLVGLGTAGVALLLVRVISIPDEFAGTADRAIGLWVGIASATVVILAGLARAGEDL